MMPRVVLPEMLDALPAEDPRAIRSRNDLRRLNSIMGNLKTLRTALDPIIARQPNIQLIELGGGDGNLLAKLAHQRGSRWPTLQASLVDMQPVVSEATKASIARNGWTLQTIKADVFAWLEGSRRSDEVVIANLFVHHFADTSLAKLLSAIAARATAFVCVEPHRSKLALLGSHCVGAIGCNGVTRHDAVASVHAGFCGGELSALWPASDGWITKESRAGLFLQRFVAYRKAGR